MIDPTPLSPEEIISEMNQRLPKVIEHYAIKLVMKELRAVLALRSSRIVRETEMHEKDHGAGLIGQTIPDVVETELHPNTRTIVVRDLDVGDYVGGKRIVAISRCSGCGRHSNPNTWLAFEGGGGRDYPTHSIIVYEVRAVGYHADQPLSEAGSSTQSASAREETTNSPLSGSGKEPA
jgi:hypothetical protein